MTAPVPELPESARAGDVNVLALEPHARGRLARLRVGAWALASSATLGFWGFPSVGEFVVRRRRDGREVLRVDAESEESTALLQGHLRDQLRELTPAAFREAWGIPDDDLASR